MDFYSLLSRYPPFSTRLCEYLPFISRIALKEVCPTIRVSYNVFDFLHIIQKELDKLGFHGKEVCEILKHTPDTVLSGSFLLKCLNGDDWKPNDMDIYSKTMDTFQTSYYWGPRTKTRHTFTYTKHSFSHQLLVKGVIEYAPRLTIGGGLKDEAPPAIQKLLDPIPIIHPADCKDDNWNDTIIKYGTCKHLFKVMQYKCIDFDFSFQDIMIKDGVSISDVIDDFDMAFVQSTFDGEKLEIWHPLNIITRKCNINFGLKYFKFIISNNTYYDSHRPFKWSMWGCMKILKRIHKYRARGYECNVVSDITKEELIKHLKYVCMTDLLEPMEMLISHEDESEDESEDKGEELCTHNFDENDIKPWYNFIRIAQNPHLDFNKSTIDDDELAEMLQIPKNLYY